MANKRGNKENLIPMAERSEEERTAIASKGGKAKAEKERKRKVVAETFMEILNLQYDEPTMMNLDEHYNSGWGFDKTNLTVDLQGHTLLTGMCCEIVRQAVIKGDLKACKIILDYIEPITKGEVFTQEESQI